MTHGGYSRLIVYLQCSSNNLAGTVFELFLDGIRRHMLPSRVRSDQGMENVQVAQYMLENRGAERRSIITGCSVHNQRIERLWRDMHRSVAILFYKLFYCIMLGLIKHLLNLLVVGIIIPYEQLGINLHSNCSLLVLYCYKIHNQDVDDEYGVDPEGPTPVQEAGVCVPDLASKFSDIDMAT